MSFSADEADSLLNFDENKKSNLELDQKDNLAARDILLE